ncbi:hypothetical protein PoB_000278800 [Plakobranchus ocellatus]|uniref:Uncharacterized protein n=1 Tax=Plakobranchus ocellatus TaxID=259542 RepID=A0AAV3Y223_9GAST|nr:hypothetical protein PoB_000278800 [Plakobranchus ocellatus]
MTLAEIFACASSHASVRHASVIRQGENPFQKHQSDVAAIRMKRTWRRKVSFKKGQLDHQLNRRRHLVEQTSKLDDFIIFPRCRVFSRGAQETDKFLFARYPTVDRMIMDANNS